MPNGVNTSGDIQPFFNSINSIRLLAVSVCDVTLETRTICSHPPIILQVFFFRLPFPPIFICDNLFYDIPFRSSHFRYTLYRKCLIGLYYPLAQIVPFITIHFYNDLWPKIFLLFLICASYRLDYFTKPLRTTTRIQYNK